MKSFYFFLCVLALLSTAAYSENPPNGYMGLFTDSTHTDWCAYGSGFQQIEIWGWCLPSADGIKAVEFGIEYPENIIQGAATMNDVKISSYMGTPSTGISIAFRQCEHDWLWTFHQTLYLLDDNETTIEIVKPPSNSHVETPIQCVCSDGYPKRPLKVYSNLCINHCCAVDTLPPYLIEVQIIDYNHLQLKFSEVIDESTAQDISRYRIYKAENPADTIGVIEATLLQEETKVSLTLANFIEDNVQYTLRAESILDLVGNSTINEKNFKYFRDLKAVSVSSVRYTRCGCSQVNASYSLMNAGTQAVGPFRVKVYVRAGTREPYIRTPVYYHEYTDLAPGDTRRASFYFTLMYIDKPYVFLAVDDLNQIDEYDENNNFKAHEIEINVPDLFRVFDRSNNDGSVAVNFYSIDYGTASELFEVYARRGSAVEHNQVDGNSNGTLSTSNIYQGLASGESHCNCHSDDSWKLVGTHPAQKRIPLNYGVVVPSYGDMYWTIYVIQYVKYDIHNGDTVYTRRTSCPDSTYAYDSLAPEPPQAVAGGLGSEGIVISWEPSSDFDIQSYFIYRDYNQSFTPSDENLITETAEIQYIASDWSSLGEVYYKITAKDYSGNESNPVLLGPLGTTETILGSYNAAYKNSLIEVSWNLVEYGNGAALIISRAEGDSKSYISLPSERIELKDNIYYFRDDEIAFGVAYRYRVEVFSDAKSQLLFETDAIVTPQLPLTLWQNHPNPFNPSTTIVYYLPTGVDVELTIYDIAGHTIRVLVEGYQDKGRKEITWNGRDALGKRVSSGVYFYRLVSGKFNKTRKMILLR